MFVKEKKGGKKETGEQYLVLRKDLCSAALRAWAQGPLWLHQWATLFQWTVNVPWTCPVPSMDMFYDGSN